jgi:hypothetical protein
MGRTHGHTDRHRSIVWKRSRPEFSSSPSALTPAVNASTVYPSQAEGGRNALLRVEYCCSVYCNHGFAGVGSNPIASAARGSNTSTLWGSSLLKCRAKVCRRALRGADTASRRERQIALWASCLLEFGAKVRRRALHGADTEGRRERQGALWSGRLLQRRPEVCRGTLSDREVRSKDGTPMPSLVPPAQRVGPFFWGAR